MCDYHDWVKSGNLFFPCTAMLYNCAPFNVRGMGCHSANGDSRCGWVSAPRPVLCIYERFQTPPKQCHICRGRRVLGCERQKLCVHMHLCNILNTKYPQYSFSTQLKTRAKDLHVCKNARFLTLVNDNGRWTRMARSAIHVSGTPDSIPRTSDGQFYG